MEALDNNKIRFEYKDKNSHINIETNSMGTLDSVIETFRNFLCAIGYGYDRVHDYATHEELENRIDLIKSDINRAIEYIEQGQYDEAKRHLNISLEG